MEPSNHSSSRRRRFSLDVEWTRLQPQPDPAGGVPLARSSHGVSHLRSKDALLVFGGEHVARTPVSREQTLWICQRVSSASSAAAEPPRWQRIVLGTDNSSPPPRIAHAQAVVEDRYLYVFGGRAGIVMDEHPYNDLWVLDTRDENCEDWKWTEVNEEEEVPSQSQSQSPENASHKPRPRSFHRMIAVGTDLYVFGGCGATGRLNDLWKFDTRSRRWRALGASQHLRGRGGANLVALPAAASGDHRRLAVVAGFAGEETNDGHAFQLSNAQWEAEPLRGLDPMRPRSVCCCASLSAEDGDGDGEGAVVVIFGGEVDPSARGHEGAGGFASDVVVLDGATGEWRQTIAAPSAGATTATAWPAPRGWSDCDASGAVGWVFGGLTGDDAHPARLGDLWQMKLVVARKE